MSSGKLYPAFLFLFASLLLSFLLPQEEVEKDEHVEGVSLAAVDCFWPQLCTVMFFSLLAQQGAADASRGDVSPLPVLFALCFAALLQAGKRSLQ